MYIKTLFYLITQESPEIICSKIKHSPREVSSIEGYHNIYIQLNGLQITRAAHGVVDP